MKICSVDRVYEGKYTSNNSRFFSYLHPLHTLSELHPILDGYRKIHPKATHICYAYRHGFDQESTKFYDAGEPSGTAGQPILNQLYSFGVGNSLLIVIRYFGGKKLGIPGLIKAYKEAAVQCIEKAILIEVEESVSVDLVLEQPEYYKLMNILKINEISDISSRFESDRYYVNFNIPKRLENLLETYSSK